MTKVLQWVHRCTKGASAWQVQKGSFAKFWEKIASQSSHFQVMMKITWSASSFSSRMNATYLVCHEIACTHTYIVHIFWDICVCCAYNLMGHWYTSFTILILLCRQNLAKIVSSAEPKTDAITGKDEDKGKGTYCILSWTFWHPRGELWHSAVSDCGIERSSGTTSWGCSSWVLPSV